MPVIAAAIIGTVAASAMAADAQADANKTNVRLARENRDVQIDLANTAHQREVADLRAAGLNPILSGTGGAGAAVPSSAAATVTGVSPAAEALKSASSALMMKKQMDLMDAQTVKIEEETQGVREDNSLKQIERGAKEGWIENLETGQLERHPDKGMVTIAREAAMTDLEAKRIANSLTNEQIKNIRQDTINKIQQHQIGASAATRNQMIDDVLKAGKEELIKIRDYIQEKLPEGVSLPWRK